MFELETILDVTLGLSVRCSLMWFWESMPHVHATWADMSKVVLLQCDPIDKASIAPINALGMERPP